jgi:predicted nuclease of predicted toxin-antitoxin system
MKFLADEGVDRSIVEVLRELQHNVYYVIEETRSLSDDELLAIAANESRILLTRDKDFGELVYRLGKPHAGVILIRLEGYSTEIRSQVVSSIIQKHHTELFDAFTVIQPKVVRIRRK